MKSNGHEFNFKKLVEAIQKAHDELNAQAGRAVNLSLTLRNWLIGCYVAEYELNGADRAVYGERLVENLAQSLKHIPRTEKRELNRYRLLYKVYPLIGETLTPQLKRGLLIGKSAAVIGETPPQSSRQSDLAIKLSFSHLDLLIAIGDDTKRAFYEMECMCGNWSVRELKRQINSLYYERSGLSYDKTELAKLARKNAEQTAQILNVRDPYVFEFLGLKPQEVMSESHFEDKLLDKTWDAYPELGVI